MKACTHCQIQYEGEAERCPLCNSRLQSDGVLCQDVFPPIETVYHTHGFFFRCLIFGMLASCIVAVMLNFLLPNRGAWSLFIIGGCISGWLTIVNALRRRGNLLKLLHDQLILLGVISLAWDYAMGWHRWSIDYVIPFAISSTVLAAFCIAYAFRISTQKSLIYLQLLTLWGLLPGVFLLFHLPLRTLPSFYCVTQSLLLWAGLLVFRWPRIKAELYRRLHL